MTRTSEWVSPGHPDKVADIIVSYILDRYLEKDPKVRFALECQIKDNFVTLGGEVTSAYDMSEEELKAHVRCAILHIGYTPDYVAYWGKENCIDPDALEIVAHIGRQSPDIAQGVNREGWGDQGIFWGMAVGNDTTGFMPEDHWIAKELGMSLYEIAKDRTLGFGLDIKTLVTMTDGRVTEVVVAIPTILPGMAEYAKKHIIGFMRKHFGLIVGDYKLTINGTGAYVRHASQGDCGTTGRKLAVDFYGGNCRVDGGCPWGKDPSKADVTLNVYAHHLAKVMLEKTGMVSVYCAINCCIGKKEIGIVYYDEHLNEIGVEAQALPSFEVVREMGLNRPVWAFKAIHGLFSEPKEEGL
jgi:S-adenosylmethionine synthetase